MAEKLLVPVNLPSWLIKSVVSVKRAFIPPAPVEPIPTVDLSGEREIEWAYIASRLPAGSGSVLDFGAGYGTMSMHAIQKGYHVLAVDLEENPFPWSHPNLKRVQGDLRKLEFPERSFDYVLNCSTVEHVGLAGRYGVSVEEINGDLEAMSRLRKLVKPFGKVLMTAPCGRDSVFVPWHRVYGEKRLPALLRGFHVEEECYWVKQSDNCWHPADRESALHYVPTGHSTVSTYCTYALGCFVLRPRAGEEC